LTPRRGAIRPTPDSLSAALGIKTTAASDAPAGPARMSTADPHTFHRPPREWPPPVPTEQLRIAAPPTVPTPPQHGLLQALMPLVGGVGLFGFSIVYGNSTFLLIAGAMMLLMLAFSVGMRASQSRAVRRRGAQEARRYASYLRERDAELAEAGDRQRKALARLYPDPGAMWTAMVKRQGVWERRPNHRDFLHVRVGTGAVELDRPVELDTGVNPLTEYQPIPMREARKMVERRTRLRGQPVVVDLDEIGVLAVTGDRERARAWARSLMVQLAAFRAPHDVHLVTAFEPASTASWEWAKWLPHQRVEQPASGDRAPVPAVALARDAAELDALLEPELRPRLEQLRRMAESNVTGRDAMLTAPELVLIVDGYAPGHPANELPAFRELLDRAREVRAVVVLLVDGRELEPSHVDARLGIPERGNATFERTGPDAPTIPDLAPDAADIGTSEATARALTPLRLAEGGDGERALGDTVRLMDLLGPEPSQARRPRSASLRVPFGITADGEVAILDLKQAAEGGMGPHGILVGATGSGKSELLRSLVAGLAATHDPETLSFVLVDYKGGAAFAELARLPHVAGMITNLQRDLSLVDRMHDALVGEQERRQTMLREAGNLDDAIAYRARREADPSLPPMPDLLVIVDEFAEMLTAKPEFIDLFVGIGRVGRSLGIHLLLSSQRLDEGRLRGLESHLRYRICLRTYSAPESKMVLGTPDAYLLPSLPGLGYLKVDTSIYEQFRAALVTSPAGGEQHVAGDTPPEVRAFDAQGPVLGLPVSVSSGPAPVQGRTDLDVLVGRLAGGGDAEPVHQVWVAPLPAAMALDEVLAEPPWWDREPAEGLRATVGLVDRPREQRTEPLALDLAGAGGHVAVVGAPRTGKSTVLRTLGAALVHRHTPAEARLYAIDLGGGLLGALHGAPHVGGVVGKLDREAVGRVVAQLRTEIEEREERFRALRLESMDQARVHRARDARTDLADVFLFVDGWDAFKREFEGLDREVEELAAAGLAFGLHVVVSTNRWADIRPALLDNLGTRLELKLNDPIDSDVSRAAASSVPADVPGRGLTPDGLHFQAALPRVDGRADADGVATALGDLVTEAAARWNGPPAEPIRLLPRRLDPEDLPPASADGGVPIGLEERRLEPVAIDLLGADPHFLVLGDAETGKTSLLRAIAQGLATVHGADELQIVVADVRRSLGDLASLPHLLAHATSAPAIQEAAGRIAAAVSDRLDRTEWTGPRYVVLCDDYDLVSGPTGSPLAPLLDLFALGRDIGLHVVLARRVGGSARGAYEPVFSRVRELGTPGVMLSGDPGEGPLLGGLKASPQPPGRGILVHRGRRPVAVQLALTRPIPLALPASHSTHPGA
jgi:S-DNA-T family DNA segregation ATPase FtsK/SpoIIIE